GVADLHGEFLLLEELHQPIGCEGGPLQPLLGGGRRPPGAVAPVPAPRVHVVPPLSYENHSPSAPPAPPPPGGRYALHPGAKAPGSGMSRMCRGNSSSGGASDKPS